MKTFSNLTEEDTGHTYINVRNKQQKNCFIMRAMKASNHKKCTVAEIEQISPISTTWHLY